MVQQALVGHQFEIQGITLFESDGAQAIAVDRNIGQRIEITEVLVFMPLHVDQKIVLALVDVLKFDICVSSKGAFARLDNFILFVENGVSAARILMLFGIPTQSLVNLRNPKSMRARFSHANFIDEGSLLNFFDFL